MGSVHDVLEDYLEMSLNEDTDDAQRGDALEALAILREGLPEITGGPWSVIDICDFVSAELHLELDNHDTVLFGRLLTAFNNT